MLRRLSIYRTAALGMIAVGVTVCAQEPQPTFRATTDRVALDLMILGGNGAPLSDVRLDELSLTVDGRPRKIESLDFIQLAPSAAEKVSTSPVPSPFGTNIPAEAGRTIMLLFDRDSYRDGGQKLVTDAAMRFLDTLTSRDRVGLVTLPYGKVEVDLTTDHDRIRKILPNIRGYGTPANTGTAEFRTPSSANSLIVTMPACQQFYSLIEFLTGITKTDGPKAIVYVGGSFSFGAPPNPCASLAQDLVKAAARARVTVYDIDPSLSGRISNSDLAFATGGVQFSPSGIMDPIFTRIARETSAYYLLGFNPLPSERDDKQHSISVKVARAGATVRARTGFSITKDPAPPKPTAKPVPTPAPRDLLRDYNSHPDVPLRAAAFAFRGTTLGKLKVVVMADAAGSGTTVSAAAFGLYDTKGNNIAGWDADKKELATRPLISATSVPPGSYRFRAAVTDDAGRMGAADFEFAAALQSVRPYELSSMMLGLMDRGEFRPRLQFSTEPVATAYLEIYTGSFGVKAPVVAFILTRADDGALIVRLPASLTTGPNSKWIATAPIALSDLSPGDYVVRAMVGVGAGELGGVTRTLRKISSGR